MPVDSLALQAGRLRHEVAIQKLSSARDPFGQLQKAWQTILIARAEIKTASSREMFAPGQFTGQVTHTITLRWPGILIQIGPGMQVVCGGHAYKIQTVDNVDGRNRVLKLMTQELAASE